MKEHPLRFASKFGMSNRALLDRMREHNPVKITSEQARQLLDDFAKFYPHVDEWRKRMLERVRKHEVSSL